EFDGRPVVNITVVRTQSIDLFIHLQERGDNCGVVFRGVRERLHHQAVTELTRWPLVDRVEQRLVILRVHHHQHVEEVLRRGAHEAGTADVDLLDEIVERNIWSPRRFRKRVQIDDYDIDRLDAELGNRV